MRNIVNFDKQCNIKRPQFLAIIAIGAVVIPQKSGVDSVAIEGIASAIVQLKLAMHRFFASTYTAPTSTVMVNIEQNTERLFLINRALCILLCLTTGCSTMPRNPVPLDQMPRAEISGMPGVRAWSGTFSKQFETDLLQSVQQTFKHVGITELESMPATDVLLLSGGGDSGAFGAGFMHGWSQSGTRPEFKLVTGISTGALIAPFAFLGTEYDSTLKEAFTTISAKDVYHIRWLSFPWSDAFADPMPLAQLIKRYITKDILKAIARAHQQGRRLYVGTTNLDADRLVIWNMGAIAISGHPNALDLFRQIILASSSVPGAFPPVLIEVEIDGASYDEMHVDGGVKAQLFMLAATLDIAELRKKLGVFPEIDRETRIFVIRNAEVGPEPEQVPRNLKVIPRRAFSSLIKSQALSDLNRIYEVAKKHDLDFNWVALPNDYEPLEGGKFDIDEMNSLFKLGYEIGLKENVWRKVPPKIGQH